MSDIHLGAGDAAERGRVERLFVAWLDRASKDASAIFLCGDLFDFWFEYACVVPKGHVRVLGKLAELSDRGVRVVYMAGNHDMWLGEYLAAECGAELHFKPCIFELEGKMVHVAHGDNLNVRGDWKLKMINNLFRSRLVRWLFRWGLHPDIGARFGLWWSSQSRKRHRKLPGHGTIDGHGVQALVDYAQSVQDGLISNDGRPCDYFIYGHLHQSLRHTLSDGAGVIFLSDWSEAPTAAVLQDDGSLRISDINSNEQNRAKQSKTEQNRAKN